MTSDVEAIRYRLLENMSGYLGLEMYDEAQKCAKKLIPLGAGNVEYLLECGKTYHDAEKPEHAIFFYRLAIRTDPKCREAYTNLGYILEKQGKIDDAIECYRSQLAATPDCAWAYHNLGVIFCFKKKDLIWGIPFLERGHRNDPENVQIHHNLAWAYYINREYEKAMKEYGELIEKVGDDQPRFLEHYSHTSEIFADFALTCFKLNRHQSARAAIKWAMKLRPAARKEWDKKYQDIHRFLRSRRRGARWHTSKIAAGA